MAKENEWLDTIGNVISPASGVVGIGASIFSAIKSAQAVKRNKQLLDKQEEKQEALYNLNQNFMDTNVAKNIIEQARKSYLRNKQISDSSAAITGASAEQQIATETASNEGLNQAIGNLAGMGTQYEMQNQARYDNNLQRMLAQRMAMNDQQAESAANLASNASDLFGSSALLKAFA